MACAGINDSSTLPMPWRYPNQLPATTNNTQPIEDKAEVVADLISTIALQQVPLLLPLDNIPARRLYATSVASLGILLQPVQRTQRTLVHHVHVQHLQHKATQLSPRRGTVILRATLVPPGMRWFAWPTLYLMPAP
jgi:hypothetical protein